MQAVLFDAMHSVHLIPENTEAFKPAGSAAGTHSDDELAEDDLTVCHQLGVSISVLCINSVSVCVWPRERESCVYFKELYNMSVENPAYSSATMKAECDVKCFVLSTAPPRPPQNCLLS